MEYVARLHSGLPQLFVPGCMPDELLELTRQMSPKDEINPFVEVGRHIVRFQGSAILSYKILGGGCPWGQCDVLQGDAVLLPPKVEGR